MLKEKGMKKVILLGLLTIILASCAVTADDQPAMARNIVVYKSPT